MLSPDSIHPVEPSATEADVEDKVVRPLLRLLGYDFDNNIAPKYPVTFQEGRKGRKPEADFVVFSARPHDRNNSLIVVEAKRPFESISKALAQAESYARALKAPFILLTDGVKLEFWYCKPTTENEKIIELEIKDLSKNFNRLESCVGKEAVIAHSIKIGKASYFSPLTVYDKYVDSEIQKIKDCDKIISRRFAKCLGSNLASEIIDLEILSESRGAIIVGASGMGKTSTGYRIFVDLLSKHRDTKGELIPFHINLNNIGTDSILEFALDTIRATYPALSIHSLESLIRERSVFIILDAFDQVKEQENIAAEIRKLLLRYPRIRLILLSRRSSAPNIELPIYEILPLNSKEQYELAGDSRQVLYNIHNNMKELCKNPLLLALLIEYSEIHNQKPNDLVQLFQTWLNRIILIPSKQPSERENLLRAMKVLARMPEKLSVSDALNILKNNNIEGKYLDILVQREAIVVQNNNLLSFSHESLRDYLNALSINDMNPDSARSAIEMVDLTPESLFPIILMCLFSSHDLKAILWKRLGATSLKTVHNLVAFDSGYSTDRDGNPAHPQEFLTGVSDGIELLLENFFPQLHRKIIKGIVCQDAPYVCISGEASSKWYDIAFHPAAQKEPRIISAPHEENIHRLRWRGGRGPINWMRGCGIGIEEVERAVLKIIEKRNISGGTRWLTENIRGWMQFLRNNKSYFNINDTSNILVIAAELENYVGNNFYYNGFNGTISTEDVIDIISDIHKLRSIGVDNIVIGNKKPLTEWEAQGLSMEKICEFMVETYTEAQHLYKEIAEENFQNISNELCHFNLFPAMVQIRLEFIFGKWHFQKHWKAVSNWDECGVNFISDSAESSNSLEDIFDEMRKSYVKIGKSMANRYLYCTGWGGIISGVGRWRRHQYESIIVRMALGWIEDDLKRLFEGR